ncbi:hypothetical protein MRB53_029935 [Persea americana]|uniref:Uncharacterized protein n=1 Tax=Persea americana TaxID=3435 RepID=A0ACC2KJX5_PERAE|nr:hypothetical protein MRB53_029935 [Persea americana]
MSGKVSDDQPRVGFNGAGALSHVYIQHPPLTCSISGARGLFYDDGNKLLIAPVLNEVFSWKTSPFTSFHDAPSSDTLGEGPVLSIRYSLDGKVIAVQRSNHEIEFRNRETGECFSQRCTSESEGILGFFWTDCPSCDLVLIKTSGLDLFSYEAELKKLRLVEAKWFNVSWYVYTHESRMVLLSTGMQCKSFSALQFSSGGVIRLPRFEMTMTKAEANNKPVLDADDVHIVTIYGRIYCLQVDRVGMLIYLYRFYRDAVVQQGSFPMYSTKIAVSVVDNVLLVHQVDAKVVILYDLFANSRAPISAPLPLLSRSLPRVAASSSQICSPQALHMEVTEVSVDEGKIYGDGWTFLVPDLICDVTHGMLWRIHLDLEAIAASNSEVPSVLEFLQRRRLESKKGKQLCLVIMRTIILERRPVSMVAQAFDVLVSSFAHSMKSGNICTDRSISSGSERAPTSDIQDAGISGTAANEAISRVKMHGKSIGKESTSVVDNEALNLDMASLINNSSSLFSDSDEPSAHMDEFQSGNQHNLTAKEGGENQTSTETSATDMLPTPLQSEVLGASGNALDSNTSGPQGSQVACVAISPDEMFSFVFALVEDEMAGDPAYLCAIIVEYLRSATSEKLRIPPNLYVMTVQLLARNERYAELALFIINKILEPSKEVAFQLLESGRQNFLIRKLGLDMLRQLSLHHDYVLILVQDGYYLEALRYARKNKVATVRPSLFLEAALSSNDSQHLAAVLRFFSDFIPGFKNTADHSMYCRILNERS